MNLLYSHARRSRLAYAVEKMMEITLDMLVGHYTVVVESDGKMNEKIKFLMKDGSVITMRTDPNGYYITKDND